MPRIRQVAGCLKFKPSTRDKKKRQGIFDHDDTVLSASKIRECAKQLKLASVKYLNTGDTIWFLPPVPLDELGMMAYMAYMAYKAADSINNIVKDDIDDIDDINDVGFDPKYDDEESDL